VMTDQGLYSPRLARLIQSLGWHPLMRVREDMGVRAQGESDFHPAGARVNPLFTRFSTPKPGRAWVSCNFGRLLLS